MAHQAGRLTGRRRRGTLLARQALGGEALAAALAAEEAPGVPAPEVAAQRPGGARRWLARHWWALALLAALTWALLYPYSADPGRGLATWGDPVLQYWSMAWEVHVLRTDPLHFYPRVFDANIYYPYPHTLAYTDHLLGSTFLVLPVILASGNVVLGFNLAVLLAFAVSAAGAYLLVEDLTGNRAAGLAAGMVFAFAPYKVASIAHLNVLNTGWTALALWALLRLWRGGGWRWSALLGAAVLWQGLSSVYIFYAQVIALGVALVYLALAERRSCRWRGLVRAGVGLAAGLAAVTPFFWPYLQVTRETGITRTLDDALQWAATPALYLAVTRYNFLWGGVLSHFGGGSPERDLFPGLLAPLLGLVGLVASRRRERWLFAALVALGFLMTLGPYKDVGNLRVPLPYRLFYEVLPGFTGLRVATRFVVLVLLGLAGLTGLGVEVLGRRAAGYWSKVEGRRSKVAEGRGRVPTLRALTLPRSHALRSTALALGVLLVVGGFATEYRSHTGMTGAVSGAVDQPVYRWLAGHGDGPVVELPLPAHDKTSPFANLYSTVYWRPIVGGNSGFEPPAYDGIQQIINTFPAPAAVAFMQGIGIEQVVVHTAALGNGWPAAERAIAADPRVREVARFGPDVVYQLAPDLWMARLVAAVPAGAPVALPDVDGAPTQLELLGVFLRRAGHAVSGSGAASYHHFALPADGRLPTAAVLPAGDDPLLYGYLPSEARLTLGGLTLYGRDPAAPAATMLSDPALPGSYGGGASFALRLDGGDIARANGPGGSGGGPQRAALLAFANPAAGDVTFHFGSETWREHLPAGLIVYRTPALPAPATVAVDAPAGGRLYPRWARLEAPADGAGPGLVAARPVVLVDPSLRVTGDGAVALDATLLPGAAPAGDTMPYTLTLDIYQLPYGTHPDGHYGYWTLFVPPGDAARRAELTLDIARKAAAGTLDGAWTSIAAWGGPPDHGGFRATLVVAHGDTVLGTASLFTFDLHDWRARFVSPQAQTPLFLPVTR
ncbi:MAG TPA: hypothetical protein VFL91_01985 [Thermomicrobiales bacterium]|nr:hypothetical protein [Thermomicrobiales bacterium]